MTIVSPELIYKHIKKDEILFKTFNLLEKNEEVQIYLQMSNVIIIYILHLIFSKF
jgi:metal-dependent HD superfamily phosphatase/phosphodiesterase